MRALLDISVLLALLDASHADHEAARAWLAREITHGWASCAVTQSGFVRIVSQPRYPNPVPPAEAINRLEEATRAPHHEFWPCEVSLLDGSRIDRTRVHGPRQVTDAYLLALAVSRGGRFATFDRGVPLSAVDGATPSHLAVL